MLLFGAISSSESNNCQCPAGVAQLAELQFSKLIVAGSNPVSRSNFTGVIMISTKWIRTCQECGNKQEAKRPTQDKELSQAFIDVKCKNKKCRSQSLDYGSEVEFDENGLKVVPKDDDWE